MDLVGIDVMDKRRKMKITILKRPQGTWSREEVGSLVGHLKPICIVHQHPRHPEFLMLHGEFSKESVETVLGNDAFEYEVIQGMNNPDLPFPVPSL